MAGVAVQLAFAKTLAPVNCAVRVFPLQILLITSQPSFFVFWGEHLQPVYCPETKCCAVDNGPCKYEHDRATNSVACQRKCTGTCHCCIRVATGATVPPQRFNACKQVRILTRDPPLLQIWGFLATRISICFGVAPLPLAPVAWGRPTQDHSNATPISFWVEILAGNGRSP